MGLQLHHIAINVANLRKQQLFYQNVLGLRLRAKQKDAAGKLRSIWLSSGKIIVMLEKSAARPKNAHLLAFMITPNQRQHWLNRLSRLKIRVYKQSVYSLYFADPEGNRVALSHFPKPPKTS